MRPRSLMYALFLLSPLHVMAQNAAPSIPPESTGEEAIRKVLAESRDKKTGVTLHVNGSTVGLLVTEIGNHFVVGRSQAAGRIVVRLDRIDAAVGN